MHGHAVTIYGGRTDKRELGDEEVGAGRRRVGAGRQWGGRKIV